MTGPPAPQHVPDQPLGPSARAQRETAQRSILNLEPHIAALEKKDVMTVLDKQSILRLNRMLENLCTQFKQCHRAVLAGLGTEEDYEQEQLAHDEHEHQVLDFIQRMTVLASRPAVDDPAPLSKNDRLIDRQLESLEDSVRDVNRAVYTLGVEGHVLTNYLDKITSLEAKLQGLEERSYLSRTIGNAKKEPLASSVTCSI